MLSEDVRVRLSNAVVAEATAVSAKLAFSVSLRPVPSVVRMPVRPSKMPPMPSKLCSELLPVNGMRMP